MRKQARRLWLGDWQRDADPDDTVVILPDDGEDEYVAPDERRPTVPRGVLAGVAVAVLVALVLAISSGGSDKPLVSEQSQTPPAQTQVPQTNQLPQVPQGAPPQGFGGADLTGSDAARAAQAAVAKFPGDVERVTSGPAGGDFVVHVIQPDGNEVHVLVGKDFRVQGSDANSGPRNFGSGTPQ